MVATLLLLGVCLGLGLMVGLGMRVAVENAKRSMIRVPVDRPSGSRRR